MAFGTNADIYNLFGFIWDILVSPAILMAIYNNELRELAHPYQLPHLSYARAICLKIFINCFFNHSSSLNYVIQELERISKNTYQIMSHSCLVFENQKTNESSRLMKNNNVPVPMNLV